MKRDYEETLQMLYQLRQKLKCKGFDIDDEFPIRIEKYLRADDIWLCVGRKDIVLNIKNFTAAIDRSRTADDFVQQLRDEEIPWCTYEEYLKKEHFNMNII